MTRRALFVLGSIAIAAIAAAPITGAGAQSASLRPKLDSAARLADWTLDGSGTWEISRSLLVLAKPGTPAGAIRRPSALAILKSAPFLRVTVQAQLRSTAPVATHERDLEILFGYQSPSRFYYVHLAGITNDVHNGIFVVNDADRKRIDDGKAAPQLTDQAWHGVRLERDGSTGRIQVFVDGGAKAVLEANDTTIPTGRVGVGSFDDTGEFRNIVVTGAER